MPALQDSTRQLFSEPQRGEEGCPSSCLQVGLGPGRAMVGAGPYSEKRS